MAGLAENRWKLLYMAGNNWKQLKLLQVAGYGKKWLKMARHDLIWLECENSLITFLPDILIQMDSQAMACTNRYLFSLFKSQAIALVTKEIFICISSILPCMVNFY